MFRIMLFVVFVFSSLTVWAVPEKAVQGKVLQILSHTKARNPYDVSSLGMVVLFIDTLPGACNTNNKRVAVGTDHPLFETVLSIALSAQAQSKTIELGYLESCIVHHNAWDFSYIRLYQ